MRTLVAAACLGLLSAPAMADINVAGHWNFEANVDADCSFGGTAFLERTGETTFKGELTAHQSCPELPEDYLVRQACEACHFPNSNGPKKQIQPRINTDWFSNSYFEDLHVEVARINEPTSVAKPLHEQIDLALSEETLPVPFGHRMPFGRKPIDEFATQCEKLLTANALNLGQEFKRDIFQCKDDDPSSLECRCKELNRLRTQVYREFYK